MRGRVIVASALVALSAPIAGAAAETPTIGPPNSIGIRLVAATTGADADPYIVARAAPGTRIRRRVEITNTTDSTAAIAVYPAAASVLNGNFAFAPAHSGNELSGWTSTSRNIVRVSTDSRAFETVTITIPRKASFGERYAVVWAELSAQTGATVGVTLVNRVGIRMYVSVGQGGAAPASFGIGPLSTERSPTGVPMVVALVHNRGKRTLDVGGTLTLADGPGGLRAGPIPVTLGTALKPRESGTLTVRLDKRLPVGPWRATLRLRSGTSQRVAVATLTFPQPAVAATPSGSRHAILVIGGLLVLLLAIAAAARRRLGARKLTTL
jgi:hypothetical protein